MNKQYMLYKKTRLKRIMNTQRIKSQNHRVWVVLKSHSLIHQYTDSSLLFHFFSSSSSLCFSCSSICVICSLFGFSFVCSFVLSFSHHSVTYMLLYWVHAIQYDILIVYFSIMSFVNCTRYWWKQRNGGAVKCHSLRHILAMVHILSAFLFRSLSAPHSIILTHNIFELF